MKFHSVKRQGREFLGRVTAGKADQLVTDQVVVTTDDGGVQIMLGLKNGEMATIRLNGKALSAIKSII